MAAVRSHGLHVERFLSTYFSPNTHLTGEALGLCYLATTWPDLAVSPRWWRVGSEILERAIDQQIRCDGMHFERSACYHLYTLDFYLHYAALFTARSEQIPAPVRGAITSLVECAIRLTRPDGLLPNVGDDDGGRLLCSVLGEPLDPAASLAAAAALLDKPEWWPRSNWAPSLWLAGTPRIPLERLKAGAVGSGEPRDRLHVFSDSGFVVARGGRGDFLMASLGLQAAEQECVGHVHDDAMSIELWCDGKPVFVDPGTFTYRGDHVLRSWYRSAAAHSTAIVDALPASPTHDPFGWTHLSPASLRRSVGQDDSYLVELDRVISNPGGHVKHRRRIVAWHGVGWLIWDRFHGVGSHQVQLRYQLPEIDVATNDRSTMLVLPSALVACFGPPEREIHAEVVASPISPRYGNRQPASALVVSAEGDLPIDLLTLVLRSSSKTSSTAVHVFPESCVERIPSARGVRAIEVRDVKRGSWHRLLLQEEPAREVSFGGGGSGRFSTVWISGSDGGPAARALLYGVGGTAASGRVVQLNSVPSVALGDAPIFSSTTPVAR